jgi:hypothetical protein
LICDNDNVSANGKDMSGVPVRVKVV